MGDSSGLRVRSEATLREKQKLALLELPAIVRPKIAPSLVYQNRAGSKGASSLTTQTFLFDPEDRRTKSTSLPFRAQHAKTVCTKPRDLLLTLALHSRVCLRSTAINTILELVLRFLVKGNDLLFMYRFRLQVFCLGCSTKGLVGCRKI